MNDVSVDDILIISDYYETDRYPGPKYFSPTNEESSLNLDLAKGFYNAVKQYFNQ